MGHRMRQTNKPVQHNNNSLSQPIQDLPDWNTALGEFPDYTDLFLQTQNLLMAGDGPLPLTDRHFIALKAASISGCDGLERLQEELFLRAGGEKSWLAGEVPIRMRRLEKINQLLSRCPSSLNPSHIKSLKTDSVWSNSEVMQAIVIMANFHALCGLYLGTCKEFKSEKYLKNNRNRTKFENKENLGDSTDALIILDERRKQWKMTQKELKRKRSFSEGEVIAQSSELLFKRALGELDIAGCDNMDESREEKAKPLMVQDFSWDEQGFSMMSTFLPDIATLLDDKFRAANSLVSKDEEKNKEQSSLFRRAVWNYVQSVYLVQHDDYNYAEVDSHLGVGVRELLDVCCLPHSQPPVHHYPVSPLLVGFISSKLKHSVKVHVSILMTEARLQSLLLFALQAVMKHMS